MWRFLILAICCIPLASGAEMYDAEYRNCRDGTTNDIVECVDKATKEWDDRLNSSYKALIERTNDDQLEPLKVAQRLWIKYRDANCTFYATQEGTIRQIQSAECMRSMTRDRTCELRAANQWEGKPPDECDAKP